MTGSEERTDEQVLTILLYASDRTTRTDVRLALGRKVAADLPPVRVLAEAEANETLIADHDPLQSLQLLPVESPAASFAKGPAPALDPVLRRPFAFDDVARLRILQQQEGGRTQQQVARDPGYDSRGTGPPKLPPCVE